MGAPVEDVEETGVEGPEEVAEVAKVEEVAIRRKERERKGDPRFVPRSYHSCGIGCPAIAAPTRSLAKGGERLGASSPGWRCRTGR